LLTTFPGLGGWNALEKIPQFEIVPAILKPSSKSRRSRSGVFNWDLPV